MLGSSLRLGPAPFTPERSAPGRFPPRALGRRCAGNRTGTAALVFGTGMQRTDRHQAPAPSRAMLWTCPTAPRVEKAALSENNQ